MKGKKFRIVLAVLLMFATVLYVFAGCSGKEQTEGKATLTLSAATLELDVLEKSTLTATVSGTEAAVEWTSSDTTVAEVNEGEIFALKAGNATITASAGGASATCSLTVYDSGAYPSMTLDKSSVNMKEGKKVSINPTMKYKNQVVEAAYTYVSSDEDVVTVDGGVMTGAGLGNAVVSVTGTYGNASVTKDVSVTVTENVTFMLDRSSVELALSDVGEYHNTATIVPTVYEGDEPVESPAITWTAASSEVTVKDGVITAAAKTDAPVRVTATYRSESGNDYVCNVNVSVILPEISVDFSVDAELNSDVSGDYIDIDFSDSGLNIGGVVAVTDLNHSADIGFTQQGSIVSLKKSDLYSGINVYAVETESILYRMQIKTVTRYMKSYTDLTKLEEYCLTDKETQEVTFTSGTATAEGYRYGGYFEMTSDIDCEDQNLPDWGGKAQFGNNSPAEDGERFGFQGTFDGNGYTIRNFTVERAESGDRFFSGIFGTLGKEGIVRNLALENAGVGYCGGALAGILGGTVENVSIIGKFNRLNWAANWMYSGLCAARVTSTAQVRNLFVNVTSAENTTLNTASAFGTIDDGAVFENVIGVGLEDAYVTGRRYGQAATHSGAGISAYETLEALKNADLSFADWDEIWDVSGDYPVLKPQG